MKKLIFLLCFLAVSSVASAQIQYNPTYNRNQGQTAPQSSSQTFRTTAYALDSNGNVYKMPIMVQATSNGYVSAEVERCVTERLTIPSWSDSHVESLNVAIATAVVCAEFRRQAL